jgi:hypothetical protein
VNPDADPRREQLVAEREELSRTVQALVDRFDLSARARNAAEDVRGRGVKAWDNAVRSGLFVPTAAVAGAAVALVGAAVWRRGHDHARP